MEGKGLIRCGSHSPQSTLALELIEGGQREVLMHRYNMAHRKAEEKATSSSPGWNSCNSIPVLGGFTTERSPGLARRGATGSRLLSICATASGSATGSNCAANNNSTRGKSLLATSSELSPNEVALCRNRTLVYGTGCLETEWS